ncbi:hypothetical protein SH668x_002100 [Planctomicrobium sp. SH668]|uniref:hypothetical protein n=1 Tax=Planctomicrobium sp. SH668 TaxID=3448126 RepID=UPI003F5AE5F8
MRARLFSSDDDAARAFLDEILDSMGVELGDGQRFLGVEVYKTKIDSQPVTFYFGALDMEIDGPKQAVEQVLGHFRNWAPEEGEELDEELDDEELDDEELDDEELDDEELDDEDLDDEDLDDEDLDDEDLDDEDDFDSGEEE